MSSDYGSISDYTDQDIRTAFDAVHELVGKHRGRKSDPDVKIGMFLTLAEWRALKGQIARIVNNPRLNYHRLYGPGEIFLTEELEDD